MPLLPRLRSLWRNVVRRDQAQRDLDDELQATLHLLVDEKIAAGLPPWEARRAAVMELGGIEPLKERVRDAWTGRFVEALGQDIKYAWRHIRRSPAFSSAAVLTLALGIGANTAMFSVLDALAFRRLAIPDPDGLFSLSSYNELGIKRYIPMPLVFDFNREGPFVEACGYNGGVSFAVEAHGNPTHAVAAFVTGRCFSVLGVRPVLGRAIGDSDSPVMTAGAKVVVISDRLWRRLFGADPEAIGQSIKIDASDAVVIGVLPAGFRGIHADTGIDLFLTPDSIVPAHPQRRPVATEVLGRLKPGVTPEQATAQVDTMWPALRAGARESNRNAPEGANLLGDFLRLEPMAMGLSATREQYARAMQIIVGLTAMLLALACVNLGGLLLTRLAARSTELGVRLALGGSHMRIAQQMMVEGVLLSAAGTILAVPLAFALVAPVPALLDPGFVGWELSLTPNRRVLAVMAIAGLAVGVLMTALPIVFALRQQVGVTFMWDRSTTGAAGRWMRGLIVAQVAMSVVMLIGSALLARSFYLIQHADPGVRTDGMMAARLAAVPGGLRGMNAEVHYPPLLEKLRAIPGVGRIALARVFPRRLGYNTFEVGFVGEEPSGARATLDGVSANFFEVAGIRLVTGRLFSDTDTRTSPRVVVISESLARALDAKGNVVGRQLRYGTLKDLENLTVVGIVANATQGDLRHATPNLVYAALQQAASFSNPNMLIEVSGDPAPIAAAVRRTVQEHGREYVLDLDMLDELLAAGPARERISALLSSMIGGLAVLLAMIGIHGVLVYSVTRRRREIGVRLAVGAVPAQVAAGVIREGVILTLIGLALGVAAAFAAAGALRSLLFGVSGSDPLTYGGIATFVLALGALAGVLPARRAAGVDPVTALRAD